MMTNARMKARLSRLEDRGNSSNYTRYLFSSLSPKDQERMMRFDFAYEGGPDDLAKDMAEAMGWEINHARAFIIRNDVEMTRQENARKAGGEPDPLEGSPYRDLSNGELRAFGLAVLDKVSDPIEFARRMGWSIGQFEAFQERLAGWDALAQLSDRRGHWDTLDARWRTQGRGRRPTARHRLDAEGGARLD